MAVSVADAHCTKRPSLHPSDRAHSEFVIAAIKKKHEIAHSVHPIAYIKFKSSMMIYGFQTVLFISIYDDDTSKKITFCPFIFAKEVPMNVPNGS